LLNPAIVAVAGERVNTVQQNHPAETGPTDRNARANHVEVVYGAAGA